MKKGGKGEGVNVALSPFLPFPLLPFPFPSLSHYKLGKTQCHDKKERHQQ